MELNLESRPSLGELARRAGLGRLLYVGYHAPAGFLKRCTAEGPLNLFLSRRGRLQMEAEADRLTPLPTAAGSVPALHFLSGFRFWYQTCFCAYSLLRQTTSPLRVVVYDDGTMDQVCQDRLRRVLPGLEVISAKVIEQRLDEFLPCRRYPALRERRLNYPHLRKLTDVHAGSSGWKLVLDSDMLFFREPTFLIDWLRKPDRPCHMVDVESAYGYHDDLMVELAGAPLAERLNVGVCGLRSEEIDWDRLEFWCRTLIERAGTHYYQEQALTAMLLAGKTCAVAPAEDYVALPSREEASLPQSVMHHYVSKSKAWYFRFAWRNVLPT